RERGRRIAACGLDDDLRIHTAEAHLLFRGEAMFFAAYDDRLRIDVEVAREPVHSYDGSLQERVPSDHADELLRKLLARHRPQTCARSARKYDRDDATAGTDARRLLARHCHHAFRTRCAFHGCTP